MCGVLSVGAEQKTALNFLKLQVKYGCLKGSHSKAELTAAERCVYRFLSGECGKDDLEEPHVLLLAVL